VSAVRATDVEAAQTGPIVVSPMRRRHLRSVLRIEGKNTAKGWSLGLFMSELSYHDSRIYLVAKSGSRVVGFAGLLFAGDDGHVTTVSVEPDWKQRRIATRLMLVLATRAVAAGAAALTLEVRPSNAPAIALYQRFGFVPVGARKNYYRETNEDALVMWATDVQSPEYAARLEAIATDLPTATIEEEWGT
jgi:ribosomal-protein-alanine N-acetyltransferase